MVNGASWVKVNPHYMCFRAGFSFESFPPLAHYSLSEPVEGTVVPLYPMQNLREAPIPQPASVGAHHGLSLPALIPAKSLREIFLELPDYAHDGYLRMGEIFERLAGRGHALLLIVLGIPACLIPGVSMAFGVAILLLSFQMALGRQPFLPKLLRDRKLRLSLFMRIQPRLVKIAGGLERLLHPRLPGFFRAPWMMQAYGALVVVLAALLCLPLPIPLTNSLAGLPILIIGIGLLERDGYAMIVGLVTSLFAIVTFSAILTLGVEGVHALFMHFGGR